jgi:hypothetical protein
VKQITVPFPDLDLVLVHPLYARSMAQALEAAKPFLHDGKTPLETFNNIERCYKTSYICHALEAADKQGHLHPDFSQGSALAKKLIEVTL